MLAALALAACGGPKPDAAGPVDALDQELTGANATSPVRDPALVAALHDQIMVDPDLVQQANRHALSPPPRPVSGETPPDDVAARAGPAEQDALRPAPPARGACPRCAAARRALTLGAFAGGQGGATGACAAAIGYSATWSTRLPASVPLYPDARVTEAAGADGPGCALRVVSFASAASPKRLIDWYYTRTSAAGFSAGHGADADGEMLGGGRPGGGAFLLMVRPRAGGGSDADLMADAR